MSGVASCRCVRPILMIGAEGVALFRRASPCSVSSRRQARRRAARAPRRCASPSGTRRSTTGRCSRRRSGCTRRFCAALAAEQLGGAIGEHLVDVHVALRARAGLPDHAAEIRRRACRRALRRRRAAIASALFASRSSSSALTRGGGLLDQREGVDHGKRHALARDAEEAAAALGLRAPQPVGRDLDGAEAVFLECGCRSSRP